MATEVEQVQNDVAHMSLKKESPGNHCGPGGMKGKAGEMLDMNGNCIEEDVKSHPYTEAKIRVPEELASMPLGFSIDSGGSVTKIVYRSNEDYKNGKRISQTTESGGQVTDHPGVLRLLHLPKSDLPGLPDFLRRHCDIMESSRCRDTGDSPVTDQSDSRPEFWYHTGVGVQHYMDDMDSQLNIRTRLTSELNSLTRSLVQLSDHTRRGTLTSGSLSASFGPVLRPEPLGLVGLDRALHNLRSYLQMIAKYKTLEENTSADITAPQEGFDIEGWGRKLATGTAEGLREELSVRELDFPQLFVLIGSAIASMIITEDGKTKFVDMSTAAGKTCLGVGLAITGAKNFDELIEMAGRGRRYATDLVLSELSNKDRAPSEDDFYTSIADETEMPIFLLGKLSEEKYKDSYTKDDVAVGVLKMFTLLFAKMSISAAQLYGKKSVVFVGSFLNNKLIRELFEETFLFESLIQPFYGKEMIKMSVMEHSGHLCALGTWLQNCELAQKLSLNASTNSTNF